MKPDQFLSMATFSVMDLQTLLHLRENFLQLCNGKVYNQWTVILVCCYGNLTFFTCKIKIGWKWPCLESGMRYDFLFCRCFYIFFENASSCFTNILFDFKNQLQKLKQVSLSITYSGVLLIEATVNRCSEKYYQ